jgi:hypothetical protein
VDVQDHALKVKGWLLNKSFNLGDTCSYTLLDDRPGTLMDLRPGQKVIVRFQDAAGVLVANRVEQKPMRSEGTVNAIDPVKHELILHVRGLNRTFQVPADCRVVLRNDKPGRLSDVQAGHHVMVTYETPNDTRTVRELAQTSAMFTGTLTAIDLTDRTVKAKASFSSKKFHLADGCAIVLNGKPDAELRELKPGDKLIFSYDDVDGVSVVTRIANATGAPATESR